MMDANNLKEAVKWLRKIAEVGSVYGADKAVFVSADGLHMICDAAEAHLATLPRKVKVRAVARIDGGEIRYCQPHTPENVREAEDFQRLYGGRVVALEGEYEVKP